MAEKRTVYNNGQSGHLDFPDVSVVRDKPKINPETGEIIAVNVAAYGHVAARSGYNLWTQTEDTSASWNVPCCGYLGDGETRLACARHSGAAAWHFWVGTDVDGRLADAGSAVYTFDSQRETAVTVNTITTDLDDIMLGAGAGDTLHPDVASVALRARSGCVLPGCFLLICEKIEDQGSDVWATTGISLVAIQYDPVQETFSRHWIGDLGDHTDATDPFHFSWKRGREWACPTYFPFEFAQHPCLRCFIPIVDYILDAAAAHNDSKKGGQLGVIEATRADVSSPWVWGGFQFVYEKSEDGNHFHTAAWTPNGIILAQGDGSVTNENILCVCSDWDNYLDDDNWTIINKVYGSGEYSGVYPEHGISNQWAGACPSRFDVNTFICGSDVTVEALWKCKVNSNNTIDYDSLWGFLAAEDLQAYVALDLHGPSKEIQNGVVITPQNQREVNSPESNTTLQVPIIYGTNDSDFTPIARMPETLTGSSLCRIHGSDVYVFNLGGTGGIYKMALPTVTQHQGLAIGPGGSPNILDIDDDTYFGFSPASITVAAPVIDTSAPGTTPVIDMESTGDDAGANVMLRWSTADALVALPVTTACWFVMWVRNMNAVMAIPLRIIHYNTGGGNVAYHARAIYTAATAGNWKLIVYTIENHATPWVDPNDGAWRMEADANVDMPFHFRFQVQGVYRGTQCPYLLAHQTVATGNEQVSQTLPTLGSAAWSVGIELHIPACGEEYNYVSHPTNILSTLVLATVYTDDDNFTEIEADYTDGTINFTTTVAGVAQAGVTPVVNVSLARGHTIQIGVTWNGTFLQFFIACGGMDDRGLATQVKVANMGTPTEVRIGNVDYSEVPNIELNQIVIVDNDNVSSGEFLAMMSRISVGADTGAGYLAMSHFNLVTPKLI